MGSPSSAGQGGDSGLDIGQAWVLIRASQGVLVVKDPLTHAADVRDPGLIPGLGRLPGGDHGNPLEYSCLENPMDRGTWWVMVHRVATSWTRLK